MAKFEIINGRLVPTAINEAVVIKAATAGVSAPSKDGEEPTITPADAKRLKNKLLQVVKHISTGKLTIDDEALGKVFDTLNKHQKFDQFYDDDKFEETHQLKNEIEKVLDDLTTAQLRHLLSYIKGLK